VPLILLGAVTSCVGIVMAAAGIGAVAAVITLAGWLAFIAGIHRYGRGADD
jgi:hypothetical protein